MRIKQLPPLDYLRKWFIVDPFSDSGLVWTTPHRVYFTSTQLYRRHIKIYDGNPAGTIQRDRDRNAYWMGRLDNERYFVHRIVYFMSTGIDPKDLLIDHIDRNGLNNKIENLRLCSNAENGYNRKMPSNNKSGFKGVHLNRDTGKWYATISIAGNNRKHLGIFNTSEEAAEAYKMASLDIHKEYSIFN